VTARVLIIEGHPVLRGVIRMACEESPNLDVVAEMAEGQDALVAAAEVDPDVVVIDFDLQDTHWSEVVRALRTRRQGIRFLGVTGTADDTTLFAAFRGSIDGIIEKSAGVAAIVDAVERIAVGVRVFTPEHEHRVMLELGRMARSARESTQVASLLTDREIEVLRLLAQGMTLHRVARGLAISPRTVETHVRKIYRKLGVHNRVQALREAAALGVVSIG
jgi:two-component system nitrate/nitrite response regulator NarL